MKRGADSIEEKDSVPPKRVKVASGLHSFVSPPAEDSESVANERYNEFVNASQALRGAISFSDLFLDENLPREYTEAWKSSSDRFYRALPEVLDSISVLDGPQQQLLVDAACNTERVADAGKIINLTCRHIDDLAKQPRSNLLLYTIRSLPWLSLYESLIASVDLSKALTKGYLEIEHVAALDFMNSTGSELRPAAANYLRSLSKQLNSRFQEKPALELEKHPALQLEKLPAEILQNILLRSVAREIQEERPMLDALPKINDIRLVSRTLYRHAKAVGLGELIEGAQEARYAATQRHRNFMAASDELIAAEQAPQRNVRSEGFRKRVANYQTCSTEIVAAIRFLNESEQQEVIHQFTGRTNSRDMAHCMIMACDGMDGLFETPRSNLLTNVIHLIPHANADFRQRAFKHLAKASVKGYFTEQHSDAMSIANFAAPGMARNLISEIQTQISAIHEPDNVIPTTMEPLVAEDFAEHPHMKKFSEARQGLLKKLDDPDYRGVGR